MKRNYCFLLVAFFSGVALLELNAQADLAASSGVYSAEQATRGLELYKSKCSTCHGEDLSGGGTSPGLAGSDFTTKWSGRPVAELYDSIHNSMPSDHPGTLSSQQVVDLIAFLLKVNKFPAGKTELTGSTDRLKSILIDASE